jgi:hypothetical protein
MSTMTSRCRKCGATWGMATKTMHCVTCHETFSTPANCDRHQHAKRDGTPWGCRPPAADGLVAEPNPYGTMVWHLPGPPENLRVSRQSRETGPSAPG